MFDAVDLSTIAQTLDEEERKRMAEFGTKTKEYQEFMRVSKVEFCLRVLVKVCFKIWRPLPFFSFHSCSKWRRTSNVIFDKERQGFLRPKCAFLMFRFKMMFVYTNYLENTEGYGEYLSHAVHKHHFAKK